jgi:subtilisin family serine protease
MIHHRLAIACALAQILVARPAAAAPACTGPAPDFDAMRPITQAGSLPSDMSDRRRVLLAVTPRCTGSAAAAITRAGGVIEYRVDAVGYLRMRLGSFPRERLSRLPGVEAIFLAPRYSEMVTTLMGSLPLRQRSTDGGALPDGRLRSFDASLPYANPYTLAAGIGIERFIEADPRHDGRGVTVAVIDAGLDPVMPQLAVALDAAGRPVRKIIDIRTSADPRVVATGRGWVDMRATIASRTSEADYQGRILHLPGPGRYRIGALVEGAGTGSVDLNRDLDGDGNPTGSDAPFFVLWRERDNLVWVDTNRDLDFADEHGLSDFASHGDHGFFRPAAPLHERAGPTAFAVQTDRANRAVAILTGERHAAMSASSAVGSNYFGGAAAGGVAPGARLLFIAHGSASGISNSESEAQLYNGIEALLMALADPRVDVVSYYPPSEWMRNDGRSVLERITRRAVRHYRKPVLSAVGNAGPTLGTMTHSNGEALAVGAYTSRESLAANTGIRIAEPGIVRAYSARGPADDGASGPSFVVPTGFVTADTSYATPRRRSNEMIGYQLGSGTSQATPAAAGAVALLIGAARQRSLPHDQARVAAALLGSARWIAGYGAHEQGAGLIDVPAAWEVLQRLREPPPEFSVTGPVVTRASRLGAVPATGRGLYEQEGWQAGQQGLRMLTIERLSGPTVSRLYRVELRGNDGTWSAAGEIALARGRPVAFPVRIAPRDAGVHSALLRLNDPTTGATLHQTLLTVVAAQPLPPDRAPLVRVLPLSFMHPRSLFVAVPANLANLRVRATMPSTRSELGLRPPGPRAPTLGRCSETPAGEGRKLLTCTVPAPVAGIWEIYVDWPVELSPEGPTISDGATTRDIRVEIDTSENAMP